MNNSESKSEHKSYHSYMRTLCGSFQDIDHPDLLSRTTIHNSGMPPTNVMETGNQYAIEIAIPGLKKEDIRVRVEEDVLYINAEPQQKIDCIRQMHREEFVRKAFHCSLLLPENVQDDRIKAEYMDGVLHITIPKSRRPIMVTKEIAVH